MLSTTISQLWSNAVARTTVLIGESLVPFAQQVSRCVQRFPKRPDDSSLHCYILEKAGRSGNSKSSYVAAVRDLNNDK